MASGWFVLLASLLVTDTTAQLLKKSPLDVRIIGGDTTTIEQFPYQLSVMYIDSHLCGGVLVHPLYALTAAHCTNGFLPEYLLVRGGSTYINQGDQVKNVISIFQHPGYDPNSIDNDLSVLKLDEPFNLDSTIQTIPLPQQDASIQGDLWGVVTGWGRLSDQGPIPMELQKLEIKTIEKGMCESLYGGRITENMFCAGYIEGGKDTCEGDSGGPFAVGGILVGLTSWGDGCALRNLPGVYTKVSTYTNYISGIIYN